MRKFWLAVTKRLTTLVHNKDYYYNTITIIHTHFHQRRRLNPQTNRHSFFPVQRTVGPAAVRVRLLHSNGRHLLDVQHIQPGRHIDRQVSGPV